MSGNARDNYSDGKYSDLYEEIIKYTDQYIVVDTKSDFIYIGKLKRISSSYITLGDVDVHDSRETSTMKEKYILDSKKYGVRQNRRLVHVRLDEVISISSLDDIIEY